MSGVYVLFSKYLQKRGNLYGKGVPSFRPLHHLNICYILRFILSVISKFCTALYLCRKEVLSMTKFCRVSLILHISRRKSLPAPKVYTHVIISPGMVWYIWLLVSRDRSVHRQRNRGRASVQALALDFHMKGDSLLFRIVR